MRSGTVVRALVGAGGSLLAVVLVAQTTDIPAALAEISAVDPNLVVAPLLVLVVLMWTRAVRWGVLLSAVDRDRPIGARRAFWPLTVGYLGNAVLPARLGEVVRIVVAARRLGVSATAATASVVIERAVDLLALLAVASVAYALVGSAAPLAAGVVLGVLIGLGLGLRAAGWMASRLPSFLPAGVRAAGARLLLAFAAVGPITLTKAWVVGLVAWACDAAIIYLCAVALGVPVSPGVAVLISTGAALGAALPAAAGALGTYELGAVAMAAVVGVPADEALRVALLGHLLGLAGVVVLGVLGMLAMSVLPVQRPGAREASQMPRPEVAQP